MVRAWRRSAARTMIVPRSPGLRYRDHSQKQAKKTAIKAKTKLFPARRPQISHASRTPLVGGSSRPVHCLKSSLSASDIGRPNSARKNTNQDFHVAALRNQPANNSGSRQTSMIVVAGAMWSATLRLAVLLSEVFGKRRRF